MIFIDAIQVKVRDGQVTNRPFYVVIGVTVDGRRDVLGICAGVGGEVARYWLAVLTEIKNRGTTDVCIAVCDGLTGLGGDHHGVTAGAGADLHPAPDPQHLPLRQPPLVGADGKDLRPV